MKLSQITESLTIKTFYHGVTNYNDTHDLITQVTNLATNGFHDPKDTNGIFFTQNISIALDYRREIDDENREDENLRGIIEVKLDITQGSIDGDTILRMSNIVFDWTDQQWEKWFNKRFPKTDQLTRTKWKILVNAHQEMEHGSTPSSAEGYDEHFGSWNIYDDSQKIVDIVTQQNGIKLGNKNKSTGNISYKQPIPPEQITGAYIFQQTPKPPNIPNWEHTPQFTCIKIIKQGKIKLGTTHSKLSRIE